MDIKGGIENPAWVDDEGITPPWKRSASEPIRSEKWKHYYLPRLSVSELEKEKTARELKESLGQQIKREDVYSQNEIADFDDVLPYIGSFGRYQKFLFLLTAPFLIFLSFVYFSQVFITLTPDHYCDVDLPQGHGLTEEEIKNLTLPLVYSDDLTHEVLTYSRCTYYAVNYSEIITSGRRTSNSSWPQLPCKKWKYNMEEYGSTIVTELNWVCDRSNFPPLAQAIFFGGSIVGGIVIGAVADRYGRIPALIASNLVAAAGGIISSFSMNFLVFALSRFLMGIAFDNCFTMMYIIMLEYVGPKYRTLVANLSIALFYTTGTVVLPWIAYAIFDWRIFSLVTSLPLLFGAAAYWLVPESARWLLTNGQTEKTKQILKRFARINNKEVDERIFNQLCLASEEAARDQDQSQIPTILDLLKTPRMRKNFILISILWMIVAVVYDGHARNTANLGTSVYVTFSIASATELPADIILVLFLDKWGRRALACGTLLTAAAFSLVTIVVPLEMNIVSATLAIIGRFCVNITFNIGLQYGAELIPTEVRAQGVSTIHIAGYVASILSPYVVDLARFGQALPLVVLGFLAMIGGFVALFLPETLGANLPHTLEDGENFGKDQSFWDFPCCPRKQNTEENSEVSKSEEVVRKQVERQISRGSLRSSFRAPIRGETLRSSILSKQTLTPRRSVNTISTHL
ncbi:organic cation transporter protein-like [Artemia franciscana]|uniref:Major facilitator superfamily (MFS) profile domain-containing protein n=1 Tax=Artemia franciscana TaxID=6661 RepID=A0AA88HEH1_ARTSF|nr:hypothetical protein QYM36_017632 [Artemia franciscana]